MLKLYHFWDSPCCFKVRMMLAEKKLAWHEKYIATFRFEHFQPDYVSVNPHAKVPALMHDDDVIIHSSNIIEYLDDVFPDNSLKPASPKELAVMREWMTEEQEYLFPLIVVMTFNLMMKKRVDAFGMEQLKAWALLHPDQERAQEYLTRVSSPVDTDAVSAAKKKFIWHMQRLETQLDKTSGPWICGETYTLADICVAPILDRVAHLDLASCWSDLPAVSTWFENIKHRNSFELAAPPPEFRMWGPLKPVPAGGVDPIIAGDTFPF